jgi:hypothetical protein
MKITCINYNYPQNFCGHWENYHVSNKSGYMNINKRIYVPDRRESDAEIARAWKNETGLFPSDWVKKNNPYNQSKKDIQYEIQGYPYMPIDILHASVKLKWQSSKSNLERLDLYTESAKLYAQERDLPSVAITKSNIIEELGELKDPKERLAGEYMVNNYVPEFGTKIIKALFENKN